MDPYSLPIPFNFLLYDPLHVVPPIALRGPASLINLSTFIAPLQCYFVSTPDLSLKKQHTQHFLVT